MQQWNSGMVIMSEVRYFVIFSHHFYTSLYTYSLTFKEAALQYRYIKLLCVIVYLGVKH